MATLAFRTETSRRLAIARIALVLAAPALVSLIPMAVAPALPAMAIDLAPGGDGTFFAQMIMTMPAIMLILGAPLASLMCDRLGIRITFVAAAALFGVAGASGLLLQGFAALASSRLLLGLAGGALQTCTLALIGRWYAPGPRERILGWVVAISSATAVAGLVLGGQLVDLFGWRGPFALYLLGVPLLLPAFLAVESAAPEAVRGGSADMGALRPLIGCYALILALTLAMFMPGIQGPFLIAAKSGVTATESGLIVAACPLGAVLAAVCFAPLRSRIGARALLGVTALLLGSGCLIAAWSTGIATVLLGFAVVGLGAGLVEPNIGSIILGRTPGMLHARASSLMISAMFLGQFLNPLAADPLRTGLGANGAFIGIGLFTSVLGALIVVSAVMAGTARD